MKRPRGSRFAVLIAWLLAGAVTGASQEIDYNAANAQNEFRWGVRAYHGGAFNEAVIAFERALSFRPDDALTLQWLALSYRMSGFDDQAISVMTSMLDAGQRTALLESRLDAVRAQRGLSRELAVPDRYVVAHELKGEQPGFALFSRPSSVFAAPDGGYYVASFIGNQVLRFSVNGAVTRRFLGGLGGIDHPFDVVVTQDGRIFVSEFHGNRIYRSELDGSGVARFGEKGTGDGKLLGPQYLADDGNGHIYVTEAGNRRVSKFDYDGRFVLSFGRRRGGFPGFESPTGVVVHRGRVYVADQLRRSISVFDGSGNFLHALGIGRLDGPEGLSVLEDGVLLVADTGRVLALDVESDAVRVVTDLDGVARRVTKAVLTVNADILAADFDRNVVTVATPLNALASGLNVQVERVLSADFPKVTVMVRVRDRYGNPYVGLDGSNFLVTEERRPVAGQTFLAPREARVPLVVVLADRSPEMRAYQEAARYTGLEVRQAFPGALLVSAGPNPAIEATESTASRSFAALTAEAGEFATDRRFDLGLRLAASQVLQWPGQRAVVFVTAGDLGERAFEDYDLQTLAGYLRNNGIQFHCVYVRQPTRPIDELEYLCSATGGTSAYAYRPEGLAPLMNTISRSQSGLYALSYDSRSRTDFGTRYMPVEVEVFVFGRSGRDELGYFAPLEY